MADRIDIRLQDYREIDERFDAVASVEMVEAVGQRWWPAYLDCIARNLKPGGRRRSSSSASITACSTATRASADFIQTYIFPGGMLLDEPRFAALAQRARPVSWDDRDGFGLDYAETLQRGARATTRRSRAGRLAGFDEAFHDLWRYYLMYCEGGFRGGGDRRRAGDAGQS